MDTDQVQDMARKISKKISSFTFQENEEVWALMDSYPGEVCEVTLVGRL